MRRGHNNLPGNDAGVRNGNRETKGLRLRGSDAPTQSILRFVLNALCGAD